MKANPRSAWPSSERGFLTLIGLLIVIVIIGILFAMYAGPSGTGGAGGGTGGGASSIPGAAIDQARSTVCRNNLAQFRQGAAAQLAMTGSYPASLESLNLGIPPVCPTGGEPYEYDPSTGQVHCVHPGHQRY